MGMSSTGKVFYGWPLGEAPALEDQHYAGWLNIHKTPSDLDEEGYTSKGWEAMPEHSRHSFGAEESLLVIEAHGHCDYPQYHLCHRAMMYSGDQYDPDELKLPNSSEMDFIEEQIIEQAKLKGFDIEALGEPKLYLTAHYG